MAKNQPTKPDDVKTAPEYENPAEEQTTPATMPIEIAGDTPAAAMTAEEAATLAHEGESVLKETTKKFFQKQIRFLDLSHRGKFL